jgi:Nucleoside phosphorylase
MKLLVTYAIPEEEVIVSLPGSDIHYTRTGIGKVNAVLAVAEVANQYKPDLILNIGTAGSLRHKIGTIVVCDKFEDRDMEKCKELGVDYRHNFSAELSRITLLSHWNAGQTCNTGDSFVTEAHHGADAYDMEGFAIAALCKRQSIPLISIKYITDKIGENSIGDWAEKLAEAQIALQKFIEDKFKHY